VSSWWPPPKLEGTDPAPLRAASERYGADALLAVHAHEEGGQWQAKWHLWLGDQKEPAACRAPIRLPWPMR
jgi:hypothetical protein